MKENFGILSGKKKWGYVFAFGIPFLSCLLICIGNGVYPFGDRCILHVDMYHQYCPYFTEFMEKLKNGGSLLYTWKVGLGSDFVALFAYYLASPVNWLLVFCPQNYVIEFMTLMIIVKIAACGGTFFFFLKEHFHLIGRDNRYHTNTFVPALVFSTAYALSGYMAAYYWNVMWLDCVVLFPLIVLGLEKLVREKNPVLYYISLSLSILSNYYISIMICLFLFFYFLVLYMEEKEADIKSWGRFFLYSGLAGGTSAVLLLPEIKMLGYSGSDYTGFPETIEWYFDLVSELTRSSAMADVYTGNDHWPNLYAGTFSLLLLVLFVLNKRIEGRKRLVRGAAVVFFWLSFSNNYLDFIWHGFHFPNSLPARQSVFYIFLILVLGFETLRKWKGIRLWHIAAAAALWLGILAVGYYRMEDSIVSRTSILLTGAFLCCYSLLLVLIRFKGQRRNAPREIFCFLAILEVVTNMAVTGFYTTGREAYLSKQEDYAQLLQQAGENSEEEFYRIEDTQRKTKNDSSLYGYQSATLFSSLMNINVGHFYQSVRMEGGKNFYSYNGSTPLISSMLSVKYMLSDSALAENPLRTLVGQSGSQYLYENQYCLPLGFLIPSDLNEKWDNGNTDEILNVNNLGLLLGADGDMLVKCMPVVSKSEGETILSFYEDGLYYADYNSCTSESITIMNPGRGVTRYSKASHRYLLELGAVQAGESVTIKTSVQETMDYSIYKLDLDKLDQAYQTLCRQTMELDSYSDTEIRGHIKVQEEGNLFLSVPAEEGWRVYVDGQRVDYEAFKDAFITVPLTEGDHEIRLCYLTPGLLPGAVVSIASAGVFALCMLFRRKRQRKQEGK